jgi:hypothetical protein
LVQLGSVQSKPNGRGVRSVTKNNCSLWEKLQWDCEVRGHGMCKEMPVIPVNRVEDKKQIIWKRRAEEQERHTGWLTPPPLKNVGGNLLPYLRVRRH